MKTVATIEARMSSSRLPGKVMLPIMGKPMLEIMVERLMHAKSIDKIVIATTTNKADYKIVSLAKRLGIGWFRGSETNVLSRVLGAANKYHAETIIELTGDCPMVDPAMIDDTVKNFILNKVDYLSNRTIKPLVPRGFDIQIFPKKVLAQVAKLTSDPYDCEHVSLYIYEHPKVFKLKSFSPPKPLQKSDLRLTVDTVKDLELVRRVFHLLYVKNPTFSLKDVVELFAQFPKLKLINNTVKQKKIRYTKKDERLIINKLKNQSLELQFKQRAAIIGCGNIASNFDNDPRRSFIASHAGAYQTHHQVKLIAAADINARKLNKFGKRWDVTRLYSDYKKMLAQERPDIVSICTTPDAHYSIVDEAIQKKVPTIICEKPFGNNPVIASKLATKAARAGVNLLINYNRRFDPIHIKLQQKIKKHNYGKLLTGTIYYSNGFANNGSHAIDLILMMFGDLISVQSLNSGPPKKDPTLDLAITLKTGATIILQKVDANYNYMFEADLLFEKSRIKLLDLGRKVTITPSIKHPLITGIKSYEAIPKIQIGTLPQSLPSLISRLLDTKTKLASNALEAVKVLKIISTALNSKGKHIYIN